MAGSHGQRDPTHHTHKTEAAFDRRKLTDGEVSGDAVTTVSFAPLSRIQWCRLLDLLWPLARAVVLMAARQHSTVAL